MSPQRCSAALEPNNLTPSWSLLTRGHRRESWFGRRRGQRQQILKSVFFAGEAALHSGPSPSLILGCCAETKRPFTLTLTHSHPAHPSAHPTPASPITTGTSQEESTPALRYQSQPAALAAAGRSADGEANAHQVFGFQH